MSEATESELDEFSKWFDDFSDFRTKHLIKRSDNELIQRILESVETDDESVKASLPKWIRKIKRRRRRLTDPMLQTLICRMLRHAAPTPDDSLGRRRFRDTLYYAARIISRFPDSVTVDDLLAQFDSTRVCGLADVRRVHAAANRRFNARVAAAVFAPDLQADIDSFIAYLSQCTGHPPIKVRFDARPSGVEAADLDTTARHEITAYTDGNVIHLPAHVASTKWATLNDSMLLLLLTSHEFLHCAAGSFRFSFKTKAGRDLQDQLQSRRDPDDATPDDTLSETLRDKLVGEGIKVSVLRSTEKPDLAKFVQYFRQPSLASWLFNAVEDGRLNDITRRYWPGIVDIHQAHDATYAHEVVRSPYFSTANENLIQAIAMMATGRPIVARLAAKHRETFNQARDLIESASLQTVYDSAELMTNIYDLIECTLGEDGMDELEQSGNFELPVSLEEVTVRFAFSQDKEAAGGFSTDGAPDSDHEPTQPGVWMDEFDGTELREKATHVTMHPYIADKPYPLLPPLTRPAPPILLERIRRQSDDDRRWHPDGPYLATDRLADFTAARIAGQDDLSIHYQLTEDRPPLRWTLVFDLSIAMEAPRHGLAGNTPLQHAVRYGTWLAQTLESQGVEVEAFGAVSGGPRLCRLYRLASPASQSIPTLRAIGVGGCRHGTFIRTLARQPAQLGLTPPTGDHNLTIFTSGDPSYLAISNEPLIEKLHASNCPNCVSRHRCRVHSPPDSINPRPDAIPIQRHLFRPIAYGLTDTAHAIEQTQAIVKTEILLFGPRQHQAAYEAIIHADHWNDGAAIST